MAWNPYSWGYGGVGYTMQPQSAIKQPATQPQSALKPQTSGNEQRGMVGGPPRSNMDPSFGSSLLGDKSGYGGRIGSGVGGALASMLGGASASPIGSIAGGLMGGQSAGTAFGGGIGGLIGSMFGPVGTLAGSWLGGMLGNELQTQGAISQAAQNYPGAMQTAERFSGGDGNSGFGGMSGDPANASGGYGADRGFGPGGRGKEGGGSTW